jgi:hypothetical protein
MARCDAISESPRVPPGELICRRTCARAESQRRYRKQKARELARWELGASSATRSTDSTSASIELHAALAAICAPEAQTHPRARALPRGAGWTVAGPAANILAMGHGRWTPRFVIAMVLVAGGLAVSVVNAQGQSSNAYW